ncbi:MAG: hypothetical protein AAF800_02260 [Planctomycetota bacterium]
MNENEFQKKLGDLMGEISTLPKAEREKLEQLAAQTKARHGKLKQTVGELQESLDYLRLSIKYLVFDLEATRRENGYLRKMLEQTQTPPTAIELDDDVPEDDYDFGLGDIDPAEDIESDDDDETLPGVS